MKKNKNKMIGMSTGFTLRSLKDLYCNNSIIKTGTMIAGVMLASCANNDNNDNNDKKDEKNKNQIDLNRLSDTARETLAKQLEVKTNELQDKINELQDKINKFNLDESDIDQTTGILKPSGFKKKQNAEVRAKAKAQITEVLQKSIKTDDEINVNDFKQLAKTLKQLVEATQMLLVGIYKNNNTNKLLADVEKSDNLYEAFDKQTNYENEIKTAFDAQLNSIKNALKKVTDGDLNEKIINTPNLKLDKKIDSKPIYIIISELLSSDSQENVINEYIDAQTATITVDRNGTAKLKLVFANNDQFDETGIIAFANKDKVGGAEIKNINTAFQTALAEKIKTLKFGTVDETIDCTTKIINDYITKELNFKSLNPDAITEERLKEYCGDCIVTKNDVRDKIVVPVMKKVFGNATLVKTVFTKVKNLLELKVGKNKPLMIDGITSIYKDDGNDQENDKVNYNSNITKKFGTATRLKEALLGIRSAIRLYRHDKDSTTAVREFFKFYFGKVGTGGDYFPSDFEWMILGKAVAKWVFSKQTSYNDEQKMRQDYNNASKALAMSILLNGVTVDDYHYNTSNDDLTWFTANDNNEETLDLTNGGQTSGLGGTALTDSDNTMNNGAKVNINFDNMIICNQLATNTFAYLDFQNVIVMPQLMYDNSWDKAQIVSRHFSRIYNNNGVLRSDFALLALFLGYFKKDDGNIIDIKVKVKNKANQLIYNKLKV